MDYRTEATGDALVVHLSGVLTFDDHEKFRGVVTEIADSPAPTAVIDLSALQQIDSAGIGMLLLANDRAGKQLRIRGVSGHVAKVVELSRLEQLIPID